MLEKTPRPLTTRFVKREPRLTKPLELRKRPQPKRQMIRRQVQLAAARMDQVQAAAAFNTRGLISRVAAPSVRMARQISFHDMQLEPVLHASLIVGARQPENRIDMALSMLDVNSMDTGQYRAMVIQDPNDVYLYADPFNDESPNPMYDMLNDDDWDYRGRFLGSANAQWRPIDWLAFDGNVSYDRLDRRTQNHTFKGYKTITPNTNTNLGNLARNNAISEAINASFDMTLTKRFGELGTRTQFRYLAEYTESEKPTGSPPVRRRTPPLGPRETYPTRGLGDPSSEPFHRRGHTSHCTIPTRSRACHRAPRRSVSFFSQRKP